MAGFPMTGRRLEYTIRLAVPHVILALLTLMSLAAFQIPGAALVKPYLILMAVYYWAINRPTLVPPSLCFALGLFIDIMAGLPLGMNALTLVLVRWLVRDQRRFLMGQPYITLWAMFALVTVFAAGLQWLLMSMAETAWMPVLPVATSALVSFFLFPFVSVLLLAAHRILPNASRGGSRGA